MKAASVNHKYRANQDTMAEKVFTTEERMSNIYSKYTRINININIVVQMIQDLKSVYKMQKYLTYRWVYKLGVIEQKPL